MNKFDRRTFLAGLVGTAFIPTAVTGSQAATEWTSPRGNQHNTGYAELAGPTGALDVDWTRSFGSRVFHPPTPYQETCYVGTEDGRIGALDISTGEDRWTTTIDERGGILPMTPTADRVFVPTQALPRGKSALFSLDRATGVRQWEWEIDSSIYSPAVTDGEIVVVGTLDGRVVALDSEDGHPHWSILIQTEKQSGIRAPPAIVDEQVVVRTENGVVAAIETLTGEEVWRRTFTMESRGSAVVRDGQIYVGGAKSNSRGGLTGQVYALDRADGSQHWRREFASPVDFHMVAGPDHLYAPEGIGPLSNRYRLHALDYESGNSIWDVTLNSQSGLAAIPDGVYAATPDAVTLYDRADGTERDRFDPDWEILSSLTDVADRTKFNGSPVPIPGGVLVTSTDGRVWALGEGSPYPSLREILGGTGLLGLGVGGYALYRSRSKR